MTNPLLDALNPDQREAVTHEGSPVLVLAGAGSGKTRVIAHRIAYLLTEKHVSAHNILAVTFTNKAAGEMKERVCRLLNKDALPFLWMGTFHGICARLLRADVEALGGPLTRDFTILDADDAQSMVRGLLRDRGLSDKNFQPRAVASAISRAKCDGIDGEHFAAKAQGHFSLSIAPIYRDYERRLAASNTVDFDDLLLLSLRLLNEKDEVREKYQRQFQHILVDEYQDTNRIQYGLLKAFSGKWHNVFAVGDEDQSIYKWRGADIQNILDFSRDFKGAKVVKLERNYRSSQPILDAANALVSRNTQRLGKNLWTDRQGGVKAKLFAAPSEREEAAWVMDTLVSLRARYAWRQMAVLYRTNAQSRSFEEAALNRRMPYQVVGGLKFYERKEVKDILAYLQLACNPLNRVALLRILNVPTRGIGKTTQEQMEALARERGTSLFQALRVAVEEDLLQPRTKVSLRGFLELVEAIGVRMKAMAPADLAEWVLSATGYIEYLTGQSETGLDPQTRIENIQELISAMREFELREGGDLRLFLERQTLSSDQDELKDGRAHDSVKFMTIHAAKGLEFPVVCLAGMEHELFPHTLSSRTDEGVEEERRLCYVGMTRAMDQLHLSWARQRYVFGVPQERLPSPFLKEIPPLLVEEVGGVSRAPASLVEAAAMIAQAQRPQPQQAFRVGGRVHHPKFGFGIVLGTEGGGDDLKVSVSFNRFGRKKLVAKIARLESV